MVKFVQELANKGHYRELNVRLNAYKQWIIV